MRCPYGDVETDYTREGWFVKHLKKEHNIEERTGVAVFSRALKMCPHCEKFIPSTCVGCPACGKPLDERLIKLYKEHKKRR